MFDRIKALVLRFVSPTVSDPRLAQQQFLLNASLLGLSILCLLFTIGILLLVGLSFLNIRFLNIEDGLRFALVLVALVGLVTQPFWFAIHKFVQKGYIVVASLITPSICLFVVLPSLTWAGNDDVFIRIGMIAQDFGYKEFDDRDVLLNREGGLLPGVSVEVGKHWQDVVGVFRFEMIDGVEHATLGS